MEKYLVVGAANSIERLRIRFYEKVEIENDNEETNINLIIEDDSNIVIGTGHIIASNFKDAVNQLETFNREDKYNKLIED